MADDGDHDVDIAMATSDEEEGGTTKMDERVRVRGKLTNKSVDGGGRMKREGRGGRGTGEH